MLMALTENLQEQLQWRTLHLAQGMCMNSFPIGEGKGGSETLPIQRPFCIWWPLF